MPDQLVMKMQSAALDSLSIRSKVTLFDLVVVVAACARVAREELAPQ